MSSFHFRTSPFARAVLAVLAWLSVGAVQLAAQTGFLNSAVLRKVAAGISRPTSIANAGDGSGRLFVTSQQGTIHVIDGNGLQEAPFLDLQGRVVCCGERGLLGLAFHPAFASNGYFYVHYSNPEGTTVVARFHAQPGAAEADPESELVLLTIEQPTESHKGGQLAFGPDGMLYIAIGDGGPGGIQTPNAQQTQNLLGTVLRIDVDSGSPYSIPADNPFAGQEAARGEIWAYGLRNPWRFSFDRLTGDLLIADVGQADTEEVNFQAAGSQGGVNYGWNVMEGSACTDGSTTCNAAGGFTLPVIEYSHELGCAVNGGYVYRGAALPDLQGAYLYGDFCSGSIWAARRNGDQWETVDRRATGFSISTFGEDEDGEIYVAHLGGDIYKLAPADTPPSVSFFYPRRAVAGGPDFSLYVVGSDFVNGVEATWNGEPRTVRVIDNQRLGIQITAADLAAAGEAEVTLRNPALADAQAARFTFPIDQPPAGTPAFEPNGIVSAASFSAGPLAPGSIATIFGTDLAAFPASAPAVPLPGMAGGGGFLFEDTYRAPAFYASPGQWNLQVPWELEGLESASLQARVGDRVSEAVRVPIAAHAPAVFQLDSVRAGQGAVLIADSDGMIAAPESEISRPVRGGEIVTIYATGLGPVTNRPETGGVAGTFPKSETTSVPEITIGGEALEVRFSGLAPGAAGLYQINAATPEELPSGDAMPLVITIGGVSSPAVMVAVE